MSVELEMPGGQKMPGIGLGTWQAHDEAELETALNAALEYGYRHIDTAFVYENEAVVGRIVNDWISSGKLQRDELFITTKLPFMGVHEDRVEMFMKKSLENLQLDYVDLYLIHFPVGMTYNEAVSPSSPDYATLEKSDHVAIWQKMEEQVDAGRTKAIGLSNFNLKQVERVLNFAKIKPACLQVELHVYLQQRELVDFCQQNGIVVVAYSPLGSPGYNKFLANRGLETKELPNLLQNPVVTRIAQKHNKSAGQVLLRFLIERNIVPIPKSVTPERIRQNFDVFDFSLDEDDMKDLYALDVGEEARICNFDVFPKLKDHPEFPF